MSKQQLDYQEVLQLIELIKSSTQFSEFKLRSGDMELELRRGPAAGRDAGTVPQAPAAAPAPAIATVPAAPAPAALQQSPAQPATRAARPSPAPSAAKPRRAPPAEGSIVIKSPMVGTVYRAPAPGAEPFVAVGQTVHPATTVCIIEVMKLMNSIAAECDGVVTDILVDDGEAVEFGQELFVIAPR